jgi:hypothetical protein
MDGIVEIDKIRRERERGAGSHMTDARCMLTVSTGDRERATSWLKMVVWSGFFTKAKK